MKFFFLFIISGFVFFSGSMSWASNFDGVWRGTGVMESSVEGTLAVDPVVFEFSQKQSVISSKDCWTFLFNAVVWRYCAHRDLEIRGGDVLYKGIVIGTFSENKIAVAYLEGSAKVEAVAEIKPDGHLSYRYSSEDPAKGKYLRQTAQNLIRDGGSAVKQVDLKN